MLGTTDNFNTETFERLHIDFAKAGWHASNKRDHFPQMLWSQGGQESHGDESSDDENEPVIEESDESDAMDIDLDSSNQQRKIHYTMAKYPPEPNKSLSRIQTFHHAPNFEKHLKKYVNGFRPENQRLRGKALDTTPLPFDRVDVWHQFKLNPTSLVDGEVWVETVKALPVWKHSTNTRFDTVIALVDDNAESTAPLVYVEWLQWYSNFRKSPDGPHGMYLVTKTKDSDGHPQGEVVEMARIRQVCMLMPADPKLNHSQSGSVLDSCNRFFVNQMQSKYAFQTIY
ncbi:hypothetical protein K435DRAFT_707335 [Dendrothele bispora CBS 962.96]|uniref:Uncharacterized protein n=1 Tax=Dendrothele bispora (strain CBS 962.96) TaxID=1314807 RepID=A0A4S8KIR0_DENBC|nr:hypothetical protein K435DRAFT_707335 [Dendrothele bispora CBS 962.96]